MDYFNDACGERPCSLAWSIDCTREKRVGAFKIVRGICYISLIHTRLCKMRTLSPPNMQHPHVKAFFTTKVEGDGVKQGWEGIGVAKSDVYLPVQKHTDTVILLESHRESEIADAVITQKKGLLIGVQVADCVPLLLFDGRRSVVGAVHAGWRGTAAQITRKAVERMIAWFDCRPEDVRVALGPSIKRECYEVGPEVKEAICDVMGEGDYCVPVNGKFHIDLPAVNVLQAMSAGVRRENIWVSEVCTHCNPADFHSYRYHGDHCGRQGGFIGVF